MSEYVKPTSAPCLDCPFRRKAAPGWLGEGSPESFIDCMQRDEPLPCHQSIDYEDPQWKEKWEDQEAGRLCAGSLIFMANKMQKPRTKDFPTMPPDKMNVFANSVEFVRYHREAAVHSWDDSEQSEGAQLHRMIIARAAEAMGKPIADGSLDAVARARKKKAR